MEQQPYQFTKGQAAVERARMSSDNVVLAFTFVVFFLITFGYFIFSYFTAPLAPGETSSDRGILGVLITLAFALIFLGALLGLGMFLVRMMRQTALGNAMEVQYSSYAWLRDWANEVAADLQMPEVEIFVTQNPIINAYALGFARPYIIVLNSGSIRYLTKEELKVVVVHEMAHIKYHHTDAMVYLQPFLSLPIVNIVGNWIAGFWRRRTELTADRMALAYIEDADLVKNSLVKVHVGPDTARDMNDVARQWQQYKAERPMNRFAQTFSSHPFLVRRLSQIDYWNGAMTDPQQYQQTYQMQQEPQPYYPQNQAQVAPAASPMQVPQPTAQSQETQTAASAAPVAEKTVDNKKPAPRKKSSPKKDSDAK